jgi:hypothetical protein
MIRTALLGLIAWPVVLLLLIEAASAADPWTKATVKIYPKSADLKLYGDDKKFSPQVTGNVYDIQWPAKASKADGSWLLLEDNSSTPPKAGWANKRDLIKMDLDDPSTTNDAGNEYTSELQKLAGEVPITEALLTKQATFYWLRGIYWSDSQQDQPEHAIRDFAAAIEVAFQSSAQPHSPTLDSDGYMDFELRLLPPIGNDGALAPPTQRFPGLADSYLRLAILAAAGTAHEDLIDECFQGAERIFAFPGLPATQPKPVPAKLYVYWAETIMLAFSNPSAASFLDLSVPEFAKVLLRKAQRQNPTHYASYLALGDVSLTVSRTFRSPVDLLETVFRRPNTRKADLETALGWFTQACRWNEDSVEAFRDKGKSLRLLAGFPQSDNEREAKLKEAFAALDWALSLKNYRDDVLSLEEMARVCGDLADFYESRGQFPIDLHRAIYYFAQASRFAAKGAEPGTRDEDADQVLAGQMTLYYSARGKILREVRLTREEFDSLINLPLAPAPDYPSALSTSHF